MDYGPITLDLNYFCISVLLAIAAVILKIVLENTLVCPFIELAMKVYSVIAIEKVSTHNYIRMSVSVLPLNF